MVLVIVPSRLSTAPAPTTEKGAGQLCYYLPCLSHASEQRCVASGLTGDTVGTIITEGDADGECVVVVFEAEGVTLMP